MARDASVSVDGGNTVSSREEISEDGNDLQSVPFLLDTQNPNHSPMSCLQRRGTVLS